jgi:hypothetical protein
MNETKHLRYIEREREIKFHIIFNFFFGLFVGKMENIVETLMMHSLIV